MHRNRITQLLDNEDDYACAAAVSRYKVSSSLEERLYATTDANHNVTSIDDVFGAVKERLVYDPYRNSTVLTSAWATTSDTYSFTIRSQGQREDFVTNTIDSRNRFYGLGIGRWMQADSEAYIDGANRYQFVKSNPVTSLDPTGHEDLYGPGDEPALQDQLHEWEEKGYEFSVALLQAFLDTISGPPKENAFQKFAKEIRNDEKYREAANKYFYHYIKEHHLTNGEHHIPDRDANGNAAFHLNYSPFGSNADLGNALGGAHFGYKDAIIVICGDPKPGGAWSYDVFVEMHQYDFYTFPDKFPRMVFHSYAAAHRYEQLGWGKPFGHREVWLDSFG